MKEVVVGIPRASYAFIQSVIAMRSKQSKTEICDFEADMRTEIMHRIKIVVDLDFDRLHIIPSGSKASRSGVNC